MVHHGTPFTGKLVKRKSKQSHFAKNGTLRESFKHCFAEINLANFFAELGGNPPSPSPLRKVSHFEPGISPTRTKNCIFALSKVNINGTNTSKNGSKSLKIVFLYKNTYFFWNQLVPPSQNSILPKYKLQIWGDANPLPLWKKSAKRFLKGSLYPSMNAFIFYYKM